MPLYIQRGRGSRKWDVDGNEYIDFLMENGALLLGHADEEIVQAVCEATGEGAHFSNDHPLQIWREQRPGFRRAPQWDPQVIHADAVATFGCFWCQSVATW